jgi:hypothetical protein
MLIFDEIKSYINGRIAEDKELNISIGIKKQYPYGHTPKPPEILLLIMDDIEQENATTFEGENASNVFLQIVPMISQMNIGGKRYNAQDACDLISAKISNWFDKKAVKTNIPKIINTRRVQKSNSYPYENGTTAYYSILRFNLTVTK